MMNTLLKLKMKPGAEEEQVILTKAMLGDITNGVVFTEHEYQGEELSVVLSTEYKTSEKLKSDITKLMSHSFIPLKDHEKVSSKWFTVTIESDTIDPSLSHLLDERLNSIEDQLFLMDHVVSDIVSEQESLSNKVDSIYSFLESSGLIKYKQLMEHLLTVMDSNGLVNKQVIMDQVFKQTRH